jgi:uncharacterized membrane-anchored protein YhcB (DUF1043 family)
MDSESFVETVSFVSNQSDRWMFVALLVIGLVFVFILIRFFMSRFDDLQRRIDDSQLKFDAQNAEFIRHLKQNNAELLEVIATAHQTISKNTMIMERVERKLESI